MDYHDVRLPFDSRREAAWRAITKFLTPHIAGAKSALEMGAGYCSFINSIPVKTRYAIDISDTVRTHAVRGVETYVGDATDLSRFPDHSIDLVLASNFFEHIEIPRFTETLHAISRVLSERGKLIIIQPNFKYAYREYFDDYTHVSIFTDVGLCDHLRAAGFTIELVMPKFIPFSLKSISLPTPEWIIRLYLLSPWKPGAGQMLVIARR